MSANIVTIAERTYEVTEAYSRISQLTEAQRDAAYAAARDRLAGPRPTLDAYSSQQYSRYPPQVTMTVVTLCIVFLVAAFIPSAMRLHAVALETNRTIAGLENSPTSHYVAALATVLMAEAGQIVFSLAAATIAVQRLRFLRLPVPSALTVASWLCLLIALFGNAAALGPAFDPAAPLEKQAITLLEAFAPPFLVLVTASVLKAQLLNALEARHAAQTQYASALNAWNASRTSAEASTYWGSALANALRSALEQANKRSPAALRALALADWIALIARERSAEEWYAQASAAHSAPVRVEVEALPTHNASLSRPSAVHSAPMRVRRTGRSAGVRTHETEGRISTNADGTYSAQCPYCERAFTKDTLAGATNALAAHVGRFCQNRPATVDAQ